MPELNYISSRWVAVTLNDGSRTLIAPWELAGLSDGRFPVALSYQDVLINGAVLELLAGLLQVGMAPASETEWCKTWMTPPAPQTVSAALNPLVPFFNLRGEQPAFQDRRLLDPGIGAKFEDVCELFHALPEGVSDIGVCEEGAMAALYAMQSHAKEGGTGYKVSLCGGGPARTIPDVGNTLFQKAWALVLTQAEFSLLGTETNEPCKTYPWTDPRDDVTAGSASHPASTVYFATPTRYLLPEASGQGLCQVTGEEGNLIRSVWRKNKGTSYPSEQWRHPLTPYKFDTSKNTLEKTPVRAAAFPAGIGWQHRAGLLAEVPGQIPSAIVQKWKTTRCRRLGLGVLPIHAYGARCKKHKVLGYLDSVQPYQLAPEEHDTLVEAEMRHAVRAAEVVAKRLRMSIGNAIFDKPENEDWKSMGDVLDTAASSFWTRSSAAADKFFDRTSEMICDGNETSEAKTELSVALRSAAFAVFDEAAESSVRQNPVRVYENRRALKFIHNSADVLQALGLAAPESRPEKTRKTKSKPTQRARKGAAK